MPHIRRVHTMPLGRECVDGILDRHALRARAWSFPPGDSSSPVVIDLTGVRYIGAGVAVVIRRDGTVEADKRQIHVRLDRGPGDDVRGLGSSVCGRDCARLAVNTSTGWAKKLPSPSGGAMSSYNDVILTSVRTLILPSTRSSTAMGNTTGLLRPRYRSRIV